MEPFERLKIARERAGYDKATDAVRSFGWVQQTYLAHENGSRGIRKAQAKKYARAFNVSWVWLMDGDASHQPKNDSPTKNPSINTTSALTFVARAPTHDGPKDLPILKFMHGGKGRFYVQNGGDHTMTHRPTDLVGVPAAYAAFIEDTSMVPAFRPGELIYIDPSRPCLPSDNVVIQFNDGEAIIRELVEHTERHLICKQHNPPKGIRYETKSVRSVHLVILKSYRP